MWKKVHAVVARSTFFEIKVCKNTPAPDHFLKLRCRKSARFLDVARCTFLQVKNVTSDHTLKLFVRSDVVQRGRRKGSRTLSLKLDKTWGFCSSLQLQPPLQLQLQLTTTTTITATTTHYISLHYTTLHYNHNHNHNYNYTYTTTTPTATYSLHYTLLYTTLHYTSYLRVHYLPYTTLHYTALHYTTTLDYTTFSLQGRFIPLHPLQMQLPLHYNCNYTLYHNYNSTTLQL